MSEISTGCNFFDRVEIALYTVLKCQVDCTCFYGGEVRTNFGGKSQSEIRRKKTRASAVSTGCPRLPRRILILYWGLIHMRYTVDKNKYATKFCRRVTCPWSNRSHNNAQQVSLVYFIKLRSTVV